MENTKLSPPWLGYLNKIDALFGSDPDIEITFDVNNNALKLFVEGTEKAKAIEMILPAFVAFGNVKMNISVIPANAFPQQSKDEYFKQAFKGNPNVTKIETISEGITNKMTFIEFEKEVVQYYDDNLGDLHGNRSTVLEEIAREVFEDHEGVFFCTDNAEEE